MVSTPSNPTPETTVEPLLAAHARRAYQASASGPLCEEETLKAHLPLVRNVVDRMKASLPAHVEVDDLYSVGLTGLIHATRKFDPSHGATFVSFAIPRIRGAVLDELRRMDWMSRSLRGKAKKLSEFIAQVEQGLGRPATDSEVAEELGVTPEQYGTLLDELKPICYIELDETGTEDGDEGSLHEVVADESQATASEQLIKKELHEIVVSRLQKLPEMQRKVLAMYYFENLRLAEIAQVFGVTESRICQIHSQAVLSLRPFIKAAMIR